MEEEDDGGSRKLNIEADELYAMIQSHLSSKPEANIEAQIQIQI